MWHTFKGVRQTGGGNRNTFISPLSLSADLSVQLQIIDLLLSLLLFVTSVQEFLCFHCLLVNNDNFNLTHTRSSLLHRTGHRSTVVSYFRLHRRTEKKNTEIFTVTPHCTRNHSQTTNQKFLGWPLWQKTNEDQANQFLSCVKTVPEGSLCLGSVSIAEQNSQTVPGHSSTVLL